MLVRDRHPAWHTRPMHVGPIGPGLAGSGTEHHARISVVSGNLAYIYQLLVRVAAPWRVVGFLTSSVAATTLSWRRKVAPPACIGRLGLETAICFAATSAPW